jgi:hypothetical protein
MIGMVPTGRVELPTSRLRIGCSTTELRRLKKAGGDRMVIRKENSSLKFYLQAENYAFILDEGFFVFRLKEYFFFNV